MNPPKPGGLERGGSRYQKEGNGGGQCLNSKRVEINVPYTRKKRPNNSQVQKQVANKESQERSLPMRGQGCGAGEQGSCWVLSAS